MAIRNGTLKPLYWLLVFCMVVSLSCNLPGMAPAAQTTPQPVQPVQPDQPTAIPTAPPTSTPRPRPTLPPSLVDASPYPGSEIAPKEQFVLAFSQAMDKKSVESALQPQPALSGKFSWLNDATVTFIPDQPIQPLSKISLGLNNSAKAANGLAMLAPVSISYRVAGPLEVTQFLPAADAEEVAPTSAVVATFSRPVVALAAERTAQPEAFTLQPPAPGRGEWLNTSTYIFYPQPSLAGGKQYTVTINPNLQTNDGLPLAKDTTAAWSFTTTTPKVQTVLPEGMLGLKTPIQVQFNIPMDITSLTKNISLLAADGKSVAAALTADDSLTKFSLAPEQPLARQSQYTLRIASAAAAVGGTALGKDFTVTYDTYPALAFTGGNPSNGGTLPSLGSYNNLTLYFTAPLSPKKLSSYFTISPANANLNYYTSADDTQLSVSGFFQPSTHYTIQISADLKDAWGGAISAPASYTFNTPPASPSLSFDSHGGITFLSTSDTALLAQAVNLKNIQVTNSPVALKDFLRMVGTDGYQVMQSYKAAGTKTWAAALSLPANVSQGVPIPVSPDGKALTPGLYLLSVASKELGPNYNELPKITAVSSLQVLLKLGPDQAMVWVTDLASMEPAANLPVAFYDGDGNTLATATTDAQGFATVAVPVGEYARYEFYAVVGAPGEATFGLAHAGWADSILGYDFGLDTDYYSVPGPFAYVYTDRPIYRPGQSVFFRAVVRNKANGRYSMLDPQPVTVTVKGGSGMTGEMPILSSQDLALNAYGTLAGSYALSASAAPGTYQVELLLGKKSIGTLTFQVAYYQKPDVEVQVTAPADLKRGQPYQAKAAANYYFGAPAGNLSVTWSLMHNSAAFSLPQYQVGPYDSSWATPFNRFGQFGGYGEQIASGAGRTAPDGTFSVAVDAAALAAATPESLRDLTLEVTVTGENAQSVSSRAVTHLQPADIYIGVRPSVWFVQSGAQVNFDIQTVDWLKKAAANQALTADFARVEWVEQPAADPVTEMSFVLQKTSEASANPTTSPDGQARLAFTPSQPGTYMLTVSQGAAITEVMIWVGGSGVNAWPNLPNQHLRLTANADSYQPGQKAQVYIPNPFGQDTKALISFERSKVMRTTVLPVPAGGATLDVDLTDVDSPNIYLAVTLLGKDSQGHPDFRQGITELRVTPLAQTLKVEAAVQPEHAVPGQEVTVTLRVSDASGKPVQGEFSLAAVDKAVLALADPNSLDILPAFYNPQPLSVRTSLSLAGATWRTLVRPPGMGGGGGGLDLPTTVRENFPDTAYWKADLVTAADGTAQVKFTLPDNLTTWHFDLRGITSDQKVGQAVVEITTAKDLMIRPQTPAFLVAGDHVEVFALLNNTTANALKVDAALQPTGFDLDQPAKAAQTVDVPANGQARVAWWGVVQDVPTADLVFTARSGAFSDSARPNAGKLTILRYASPQTFATSGVLSEPGEQLELIALPQTFTPTGGELRVELSPSLAAAVFTSLDVLNTSTAADIASTVSRFLPQLELFRALNTLKVDTADLQPRLQQSVAEGIETLVSLQNGDGGWSWSRSVFDYGVKSDPSLSAYVTLGLAQARASGFSVPEAVMAQAVNYLKTDLELPYKTAPDWKKNQLPFSAYALQQAGEPPNPGLLIALFGDRAVIDPAGQAVRALTIEAAAPGSQDARTLISDLETAAVRSAAGASWESASAGYQTPASPVYTTAVVLYALAQRDPAAPILSDAVRYLAANRDQLGTWYSAHQTAWAIMGLTAALQGTGELQAAFQYSALLNDSPIAKGDSNGPDALKPVTAVVPLSDLFADGPNALRIIHAAGTGRLYYRADLVVSRPVESALTVSRGLTIERAYFMSGVDCRKAACQPISGVELPAQGQPPYVTARLTVTLAHDAYNLVVEDYIPAGALFYNPRLKTAQQSQSGQPDGLPTFDAADPFGAASPFGGGYGWWFFNQPQNFDDHIRWTADYLPAGTYQFTYKLIPTFSGEFRVLPARAWLYYFPDVQGASAGSLFTITKK